MDGFWDSVQYVLHLPLVRGALTGWLAAAVVDFSAFRSWQSFNDAYAYDWPKAAWRWLQGAVSGFLGAAGLDAVS